MRRRFQGRVTCISAQPACTVGCTQQSEAPRTSLSIEKLKTLLTLCLPATDRLSVAQRCCCCDATSQPSGASPQNAVMKHAHLLEHVESCYLSSRMLSRADHSLRKAQTAHSPGLAARLWVCTHREIGHWHVANAYSNQHRSRGFVPHPHPSAFTCTLRPPRDAIFDVFAIRFTRPFTTNRDPVHQ